MKSRSSITTRRRGAKQRLSAIPPGEVLLREFMEPIELSMNKLALDLRVPATRIAQIVHGRRAITIDTALRLGRYFNTSPRFWMNLQTEYEIEIAEDELMASIVRDVKPLTKRSA